MSQELERRPPPDIDVSWRFAQGFAKSGYFKDAASAEQAFVKVVAGAEMGLMPFQAMQGIHIIQGKPVVGAGLLAAMLDQHPDYQYETEWEPDQAHATACTVVIFKGGKERGRSRFSLEDKERAGLVQANWQKFPANMLFARAMSNAVRWYAPGLTGQSVYVEGELTPDAANVPVPVLPVVTATVVDESDLPWLPEDASATPAGRIPAESPVIPGEGQTVAPADEPAAMPAGSGGLIETLADAQKFIAPLKDAQLGVVKRMLDITGKTTKREMAELLLQQRFEWDPQDILAEMAGWA